MNKKFKKKWGLWSSLLMVLSPTLSFANAQNLEVKAPVLNNHHKQSNFNQTTQNDSLTLIGLFANVQVSYAVLQALQTTFVDHNYDQGIYSQIKRSDLAAITSLDLSGLDLVNADFLFNASLVWTNLHTLNLSYNDFSAVNLTFDIHQFPNLYKLSITNSQLTAFPNLQSYVNQFNQIRYLDFANNAINALPTYLDQLSLGYLDLSNNKLVTNQNVLSLFLNNQNHENTISLQSYNDTLSLDNLFDAGNLKAPYLNLSNNNLSFLPQINLINNTQLAPTSNLEQQITTKNYFFSQSGLAELMQVSAFSPQTLTTHPLWKKFSLIQANNAVTDLNAPLLLILKTKNLDLKLTVYPDLPTVHVTFPSTLNDQQFPLLQKYASKLASDIVNQDLLLNVFYKSDDFFNQTINWNIIADDHSGILNYQTNLVFNPATSQQKKYSFAHQLVGFAKAEIFMKDLVQRTNSLVDLTSAVNSIVHLPASTSLVHFVNSSGYSIVNADLIAQSFVLSHSKISSLTAANVKQIEVDETNGQVYFQLHFLNENNNSWISNLNSLTFNWNNFTPASVQVLGQTASKKVIASPFIINSIASNLLPKFKQLVATQPSSVTAQSLLDLNLIRTNRSDWKIINSNNINQYLRLVPNDQNETLVVDVSLPGNHQTNLASLQFKLLLDFKQLTAKFNQQLQKTRRIQQADETTPVVDVNALSTTFSRKTSYEFMASLVNLKNFDQQISHAQLADGVSLQVANLYPDNASGTLWINYTLSHNGITSGFKKASISGFNTAITNKITLNLIASELNFITTQHARFVLPSSLSLTNTEMITEFLKAALLENISLSNLGTNTNITYTKISGDDRTGVLTISFNINNGESTSDSFTVSVGGFLSAQQLVDQATATYSLKTNQTASASNQYPSNYTDDDLLKLFDSFINPQQGQTNNNLIKIVDQSIQTKVDINGTVLIKYKLAYTLNDITYKSTEFKTVTVSGFLSYTKDLNQTLVSFSYTKPASETREQNQILASTVTTQQLATSITPTYNNRVNQQINFQINNLNANDTTGTITVFYHTTLTMGDITYVSTVKSATISGFLILSFNLNDTNIVFSPKNTAQQIFASELTSTNWSNFLNINNPYYIVSNVTISDVNDSTGTLTLKYKIGLASAPTQLSQEKTANLSKSDGTGFFLTTQKDADNGYLGWNFLANIDPNSIKPSTITTTNLTEFLSLGVENTLNSTKNYQVQSLAANDNFGTLTITYTIISGTGSQTATSSPKIVTIYGFLGSNDYASIKNELNNAASKLTLSPIQRKYANDMNNFNSQILFKANDTVHFLFPTSPEELEISQSTSTTETPISGLNLISYVFTFKNWTNEQIEALFAYIANNMYSPVAEAYLNRIQEITFNQLKDLEDKSNVITIQYGNHGSNNEKYSIGNLTKGGLDKIRVEIIKGYNTENFTTRKNLRNNSFIYFELNLTKPKSFKYGLLFTFFKFWQVQIYEPDLRELNFPTGPDNLTFDKGTLFSGNVYNDSNNASRRVLAYTFKLSSWTDKQTDDLFSWMASNPNHPLAQKYLMKLQELINQYFLENNITQGLWFVRIGDDKNDLNQVGGLWANNLGIYNNVNNNNFFSYLLEIISTHGNNNLKNGFLWTLGYKRVFYQNDFDNPSVINLHDINTNMLQNFKINYNLPPNTKLMMRAGSATYDNLTGTLTFQAKLVSTIPNLVNIQASTSISSDLHTYTIQGFMDYQTDVNEAQVTFVPKPNIITTLPSMVNNTNYKDYLGEPIVHNFVGKEIGLEPKVSVQIEQTNTPGVIKVLSTVSVTVDKTTYTSIQPQIIQIGNFQSSQDASPNPLLANYSWIGGPKIAEVNNIRASSIAAGNLSDYYQIQPIRQGADTTDLYPHTSFNFQVESLFPIDDSGLLSVRYKVIIITNGVRSEIERIDFVGVPTDTNPNQHFMTTQEYLDRSQPVFDLKPSLDSVSVNQITEVNYLAYIENIDKNATYNITDFKILFANPLSGDIVVEYKLTEDKFVAKEIRTQRIGGFMRSDQLFAPLVFNLNNGVLYANEVTVANWQTHLKHNALPENTTMDEISISEINLTAGTLKISYYLRNGLNSSILFTSLVGGFQQLDLVPFLSKSEVSVPLGNDHYQFLATYPLANKALGYVNGLSDLLGSPINLLSAGVKHIWKITAENLNQFVTFSKNSDDNSITLHFNFPELKEIGVAGFKFSQTYTGFFNFTSEWTMTKISQNEIAALNYQDFEALKKAKQDYLSNKTTDVTSLQAFLNKLTFGIYYNESKLDPLTHLQVHHQPLQLADIGNKSNSQTMNETVYQNHNFIFDLSKINFTDDYRVVFNPNSVQALKHYVDGIEKTEEFKLHSPLRFNTLFTKITIINDISVKVGVPVGIIGGLTLILVSSWFLARYVQIKSGKLSLRLGKKRF